MTEWLKDNWLAVLLFLSWLPLFSYLLPLPTVQHAEQTGHAVRQILDRNDAVASKFRLMRKQVDEIYQFYSNPQELQKWLVLRWGALFLSIFTGVFAAILALRRSYLWKVAVVTAAGCYLLFIYLYSGVYLPGRLDSRSWLVITTQLDDQTLLFYRELLFPFIQLVLAIIVFFVNSKEHLPQNAEFQN